MSQLSLTTEGKITSIIVDGVVWSAPIVAAPTPVNNLSRLLYSMNGPHEGAIHGVPSDWSWATVPSMQNPVPPAGMGAVTAWGQVYADSSNVLPANTRVAFKGIECWAYAGKWIKVQGAEKPFGGGHYVENFAGNASVPWSQRTESDGSVSVDMVSGFNIHFYPEGRATVPAGTTALYTTVQARLIKTDPNGADNRSSAKWLCNMGADWWRDLSVGYGDGSNNPGVGQGRFMYLSSNWQAFNFYTGGPYTKSPAWTEAQIKSTPPPMV